MRVQITEPNWGVKIAVHDGHSYNQKRTAINSIHWRCTKNYRSKCPAILKTKNKRVIETKGAHNHDCVPSECKAEEVVNQTKRTADIQHQLWRLPMKYPKFPIIMQFSLNAQRRHPILSSVSKTTKRCVSNYLPQLIDIVMTLMSLLSSFFKTMEKMIMREFLYLEMQQWKTNTWLVDGTFKLSPEIFHQIYIIHVELHGFAPPGVYVLVPNKTEKTIIE